VATLASSCAECHEIWEPQPPGTLRACPRPVQGLLYLKLTKWGGGWPTSRPGRFTPANNPVSTTGNCRKSYNEELGYLSLSTKYCSGGQIKEGERVGRYEEKRNECSGLVGEGERKRP